MRRFWRPRDDSMLEARLERRRRKAKNDFVNRLAAEIRSSGRRRLFPSRVLLAALLTLLMLAAVAAVGGVDAGAGVRDQLFAVAKSVNKKVSGDRTAARLASDDDDDDDDNDDNDDDDDGDDDPDDDQYKEERRQCRKAATQAYKASQEEAHDAYSDCKKAEQRRHKTALRACDDDKSCESEENARHKQNMRECREAWEKRMRELAEAHRAAQQRCNQIGR